MADLETIHRVVEKLEIFGDKEAIAKMDRVADATADIATQMDGGRKGGRRFGETLKDIGRQGVDTAKDILKIGDNAKVAGDVGGIGMKGLLGEMIKANVISEALTGIFSKLLGYLGELASKWWDVNQEVERMESRVRGMGFALIDWDDNMNRVRGSTKLTGVLMREFSDMGVEMGIDVGELETAYSRINVVVSGLGKSQAEVLKYTELTAAAAKIYAGNIDDAGTVVSKALIEGIVEGESSFARAFQTQLGALPGQGFQKLPLETRISRIKSVLEDMAEPIDIVKNSTEGALVGWKILSEDILQRLTVPLYEKIGGLGRDIVGYLYENEAAINAGVDTLTHWFEILWDAGGTVFKIGEDIYDWVNGVGLVGEKLDLMADIFNVIVEGIGGAFKGFELLREIVKSVNDPEHGMGKLPVLAEQFKVKLLVIAEALVDVGKQFFKAFGFDDVADSWINGVKDVEGAVAGALSNLGFGDGRKDFGVGTALEGLSKDMAQADVAFTNMIKGREMRLHNLEQSLGLDPTTRYGEQLEREAKGAGLDKERRRKFLEGLFGKKRPLINVEKMEVNQDFRDSDPDNIMVEMVRTFERLADEALSSNVAGDEATFSAGA